MLWTNLVASVSGISGNTSAIYPAYNLNKIGIPYTSGKESGVFGDHRCFEFANLKDRPPFFKVPKTAHKALRKDVSLVHHGAQSSNKIWNHQIELVRWFQSHNKPERARSQEAKAHKFGLGILWLISIYLRVVFPHFCLTHLRAAQDPVEPLQVVVEMIQTLKAWEGLLVPERCRAAHVGKPEASKVRHEHFSCTLEPSGNERPRKQDRSLGRWKVLTQREYIFDLVRQKRPSCLLQPQFVRLCCQSDTKK